jgi:two-component system response regulator RegX3
MQARVVVIEDEKELGELLRMYLEKEGMDVRLHASAEDGLAACRAAPPDLVVLDINLPGMDGFEFLQAWRKESGVPVIIVSAREADEDIIMGLGVGADEFITKPFAPKVLMARIRALVRRSRSPGAHVISFGLFTMDLEHYSLTREGRRIVLSTREFEVLRFLATNPGRAFTPREIYEGAWGVVHGDLSAVAVYVRRLRQKIEDDSANPAWLLTIHGHGYRFTREA